MPTKVGKPNLNSQFKTSMRFTIPRGEAKRPGKVGEVATNSKAWNSPGSGGGNSSSSAPKRSKGNRMY